MTNPSIEVVGGSTLSKKQISPYDLNAGDTPGLLITPVQLKGPNYNEWARAVSGALRARRKFGFLDGTVKQPESGDLEDWWQVNSLIICWIMNTVEQNLGSTIDRGEVAKELWDDIQQRFVVMNASRVQQLKRELANCRQQGDSIMVYHGKLKKLWDELKDYDPAPECTCAGCRCEVSKKFSQRLEEEKIHQFLLGLDEPTYKTVRSSILSRDPLPSLNRVYHMVVQEEGLVVSPWTGPDQSEPVGFYVTLSSTTREERKAAKAGLTCTYCNQKGHDIGTCFQRLGYPDWLGDRPRGPPRSRGSLNSSGGSRSKPGVAAKAHMAMVYDTPTANAVSEFRKVLEGLSPSDMKAVVNSLSGSSDPSPERLSGPKYQDADWSGTSD